MEEKNLSHGLWAATAPPPPGLSPVEGDQRADVAIIGGGYTGLSAALHLAEAGADAILLEAREIGFGGAGRNVGLVNAGLWLMPEDVVRILGADFGERLLTVLGASPELVFGLIEKHGGTAYTVKRAKEFVEEAKNCLASFYPSEAKTAVMALADYVIERRS